MQSHSGKELFEIVGVNSFNWKCKVQVLDQEYKSGSWPPMGRQLVFLDLFAMKLCILFVLAIASFACCLPAPITLEQMELELQQAIKNQDEDKDSVATLRDVADVGSQHSDQGARKLRHIYGGPWSRRYTYFPQIPCNDYYYYYNYWW